MTKEEYDKKKEILRKKHNAEIIQLAKEYALANNPYNVGDTVKDHRITLKIEKITFDLSVYGYPSCVYHGTLINKNGEERRNKKTGESIKDIIWQSNIEE